MEWYDDRNTCISNEREPTQTIECYHTPREIYDYLDKHIWKQDEAKKSAAMIVWKALNGIKSNVLFCGPSGSGKTEIWRQLEKIFPDRISINDVSNLTQDGWRGDKKWSDILRSVIGASHKNIIIVLDEADKMISPSISAAGENVSQSVMNEGLKIIEGTTVQVKDNKGISYTVDTRRISFVLCGAFSNLANDIAERDSGACIGFGTSQEIVRAYSIPLTEQDIIDYGAMPEFVARFNDIVNLQPLLQEDFYHLLTQSAHGPIQRLEQLYKIKLCVSDEKCQELANSALESGLGVRKVNSLLTQLIDNELFKDSEQCYLEF